MKSYLILLLLIIGCLFSCDSSKLVLIENGSTIYEIVIPENADENEMRSANELQKYLQAIAGTELPITVENKSLSSHKILIGNAAQIKSLEIEDYEIIIKTQDQNLIIAGSDGKSTLNAVYTFLENYLGCRFYAPDAEAIPETNAVAIPTYTDYRYLPSITTRTVHSKLFYDNTEFADKSKVTHEAFPNYVPSARVHTFHVFVPSDKYYAKHPEYYALRNGKRIPTQLCLTNPDVLEIVTDTVASLFNKFPESQVISVSQDDNVQYCQCEQCMSINNQEGTAAGSVIDFVNKIAEEFPEKTISTLAYQYTRTAPKNLKPKENVLITLCSIECDRSAPIAEKCSDFADDLIAWGKLTDNIRIWDYTTQFTNFLAPFPNIYTLQPNIQLFRDNNAKWIFEQHSHQPSELFELRSYLTSKLLWDPSIDQDSIINDFLKGYYEEAAPYIQKYITTVHEEIKKDNDFFLFLYGDPSQGFTSFLRPELLRQYDQWYNEAEKSVQDKPDIDKRVKQARISIDFAILEAARINDPNGFALAVTNSGGQKIIPEELQNRLSRFKQTCEESGITMMNEMRFTVDEYLQFYEHTISRALEENIAFGKKVQLLQSPKKYANEDPKTLTDGALGGSNFYANWLGFEGNNLEAIIDLENEHEISNVSCDFLQVVNHIVFFPTEVNYYYSTDAKNFKILGAIKNSRPLTAQSKINDVQSFTLKANPVSARYVKIVAKNLETAPIWHHGAGLPCWIFADEVTVD